MDPAVAVVVPWYRQRLTADERVSWRQLSELLGEREIVVLKPESLGGTLGGRPVESFADECFTSVDAYSRLLLSADFYRRFERFEFILIHQLDALVLADRLDEWLEMPWDYVGAPWLVDQRDPSRGFSRVGNGGFCLRRVGACLRVLEEGRPPSLPADLWRHELPDQQSVPLAERIAKKLWVLREAGRGAGWYAGHYTLNEDHFWCDRAHLFGTGFTVAPVAAGLEFAFEYAPRLAFEQSGDRLPFGAHAWAKHDRDFWQPHVLSPEPARVAAS